MTKKEQLIQKLNTSYAEHRESWLHMKPEDLILLASNITAADYAVRCIPDVIRVEEEVEYFLQFKDPLNVLSDMISESLDSQYGYYGDSLSGLIYELIDKGDALDYYDLEPTEEERLEKVREFLTSDTHILENFTDIEICCEKDLDDAHKELERLLSEMGLDELEKNCNEYYGNTAEATDSDMEM